MPLCWKRRPHSNRLSKLANLPQDLRIEILSHLDVVSLARCAMTCRSLRDTVQSTAVLVCAVQLHLDGLERGGAPTGHADLLAAIARRRQAWRALDGTEPLTRETYHGSRAELVGGAWASMSKHRLEVVWLPAAGDVEVRRLQVRFVDVAAREFTMDPTQDLLVFLENRSLLSTIDTDTICVHVRSLATNTDHPRARQSPLQFTVVLEQYWNSFHRATFQIAYNILAVYFRDAPEGTRVFIWDWTTSDLLLDTAISFNGSLPTARYGFGLLDPTSFFLTCPSAAGSLRLYTLVPAPDRPAGPVHRATLHLPPTAAHTHIRAVTHAAGAVEARPPPHRPFMVHDADRVHVVRVVYGDDGARAGWAGICAFNLFVHQRVLSEYARADGPGPADVEWRAWGPRNTRFMEATSHQFATHLKRYVYGQRVVFPGRNVSEDGQRIWSPRAAAYIFDFSHAAVLCAKGIPPVASSLAGGKQGTLVPPSRVRARTSPFFRADVETRLPCVVASLGVAQRYLTYMLYAEGVVGVHKVEGLEDAEGHVLHIYPA